MRAPRLATRHKTALARLAAAPVVAARRLAGRGPELEVSRRGIRWRLDLREGIDFAIWLLGSFEPSTRRACERLVEPGETVVDIGANVGAHTLQLARLVGDRGRVIAVEPTGFAFGRLEENLALNPGLATRATAVQAALIGRRAAEMPTELYASWPLRGGADLHPAHRGRAHGTEGARAVTLDELVGELGVDRVELVKLDVDGYECEVLHGGQATLREHGPPIVLELAPYALAEAGASLGELCGLLSDADYELCRLDGSRPLPMAPARLAELIPAGGSINALARVQAATAAR